MIRGSKKVVDILAKVLYEVKEHHVSVDVAFKRVCKGRCVKGLEEREELYNLVRDFISDYFKLKCYVMDDEVSYRELARLWLGREYEVINELHCIYSYPKWFVDELVSLLGVDEASKVLNAMNSRVWWLRVNTLRTSEEGVLRELELEGVDFIVSKELPYMIKVLSYKKPIRTLKPVKEFKVVPQDLASAVVVEALKPGFNESIIDLAAAPGLKTSLIMMLSENRARVVACDKSLRRLNIMRNLLKRLGVDLSRVSLIHSDSTVINFRRFDKALVDAPCSNSGAIHKDPGIKISLTKGKVLHNSVIQSKLLSNALRLADYVTFSTCSILPEEGEFIISKLDLNEVKLSRTITWASKGYPVINSYESLMRLMPHIHECEGFFIATLTR
jgi:16S rRNA (cytosine967-C5)-methyltransferase